MVLSSIVALESYIDIILIYMLAMYCVGVSQHVCVRMLHVSVCALNSVGDHHIVETLFSLFR